MRPLSIVDKRCRCSNHPHPHPHPSYILLSERHVDDLSYVKPIWMKKKGRQVQSKHGQKLVQDSDNVVAENTHCNCTTSIDSMSPTIRNKFDDRIHSISSLIEFLCFFVVNEAFSISLALNRCKWELDGVGQYSFDESLGRRRRRREEEDANLTRRFESLSRATTRGEDLLIRRRFPLAIVPEEWNECSPTRDSNNYFNSLRFD